ncbi:MAG TPA: ribonuclease HII, partial [Mariprofundaceae bacterium]|nr:ribonuclease HII [Mariprofundaceae bacterium]
MIAGVDEVGRGPLAGPVVSAAVILSPDDSMMGEYRDSKRVSEKKRIKIYHHIRKHAVSFAVAAASLEDIEQLNILHATMAAMTKAVLKLDVSPSSVIVDGNRVPENMPVPTTAVIGGDDSVQQIAAASILAKVVRDRLMRAYDFQYPQYQFGKHKGYGTKLHMDALKQYGICPIHRKTFAP